MKNDSSSEFLLLRLETLPAYLAMVEHYYSYKSLSLFIAVTADSSRA